MHSALRDAVPDGVSSKHAFQRLFVQAETNASTSRGVPSAYVRAGIAEWFNEYALDSTAVQKINRNESMYIAMITW